MVCVQLTQKGSSCNERYKYAFLAGFPRSLGLQREIKVEVDNKPVFTRSSDQSAMVKLMNEHGPEVLCQYYRDPSSFFDMAHHATWIKGLEKVLPAFPDLVVGLDLMGDELGYPFIPFTLDCVIKFFLEHSLGVRVHGGENPLYSADPYKGLPVHMAIMTLGLMEIAKFTRKLRIGHGTAWVTMAELAKNPCGNAHQRVLPDFLNKAMKFITQIPCEINITSNEYLLHAGHIGYDEALSLHPLKGIQDNKWKFVLATDNDGIWPIGLFMYLAFLMLLLIHL